MFDANEAEYGFYRAIFPYLDTPLWDILNTPSLRSSFFNDCRTVGNQMHGSLGFAGAVLLGVLQNTSLMASTWLLKAMALFYSTLGLIGWLIGLKRALPKKHALSAIVIFSSLYTFAPPVFIKIGLLHWGTHELACAALGVLMGIMLPWLIRPITWKYLLIQSIAAGFIVVISVLFNYSLLLPLALFWGAWLVSQLLLRPKASTLLRIVCVFLVATLSGGWLVTTILSSGFFIGLGFPLSVPTDSFLMLAGKQGHAFIEPSLTGWKEWLLWKNDAWPKGMKWLPGPAWGDGWSKLEELIRVFLFICAFLCGISWLIKGQKSSAPLKLGGILAVSWVVGWIAITILCLGYSIDGELRMGITPRYYALLYPMGFAWMTCATLSTRRLGFFILAPILYLGVQDTLRYIDLKHPRDQGYDATMLYFNNRQEWPAHMERIPYSDKSSDWQLGYSVITKFQHRQYWVYWTASEKYSLPLRASITEHRITSKDKISSESEFETGIEDAMKSIYSGDASEWLNEQMSIPP
jgi:hypothetical protein